MASVQPRSNGLRLGGSVGKLTGPVPLAGAVQPVRLLELEPQLGYELSEHDLGAARAQLTAGLVKRACGEWHPGGAPVGTGPVMIISTGFLLRASELGGRHSAQLLGPGDLVTPSVEPDVAEEVPPSWRFLTASTLVVLDDRALAQAAAWPSVIAALMHRWGAQAQRAAVQMDIVKQSHIEMRVMLMLWHFAQRWGRVGPEGILLPLPLTHAVLGQLVGARRPTVSLAVKQLEREGALSRGSAGAWILDERFLSEAAAPRPTRASSAPARGPAPAAAAEPPVAAPGVPPAPVQASEAPERRSEIDLLRRRIEQLRRAHALNQRRTSETMARYEKLRR